MFQRSISRPLGTLSNNMPGHQQTGSTSTNCQSARHRSKINDPADYLEHMQNRALMTIEHLKSQGFETVCQHGQRISTSIQFNKSLMDEVKWNEIFIGKLPRDLFEDQLLPFLRVPGQVYMIRFMMDFSRTNRGYCFVKYATTEQAIEAINYLDGRIVVPNKPPIGAMISFDNKCLFFEDLPEWCTDERLVNALKQAEVEGIVGANVFGPSRTSIGYQNNRRPRSSGNKSGSPDIPSFQYTGYQKFNKGKFAYHNDKKNAYVYFESHDAATRARRLLLPGDVLLFNRKIRLQWAKSDIPPAVENLIVDRRARYLSESGLWSLPKIASPNLLSLVNL